MNAKDIQCALYLLRYYTGAIDGIFGDGTKKAILEFQDAFGGLAVDGDAGAETQKALRHAIAYNMVKKQPASSEPNKSTGTFWDSIKFFSRKEMACKCGTEHAPYCNGFPVEPNENLMVLADSVRVHYGKPMTITSGIRCERHNADQPNASANSKHKYGKAMDFYIANTTSAQILSYLKTRGDVSYCYAVNNRVVHMDVS